MKLKFEKTDRGFVSSTFEDYYGKECSIQESSLATKEAIWLGCDEGTHTTGIDGEPVCLARMHLTKKHAKMLIKVLQYFVDHGRLPDPTE